jgi:hypothetical protein
MGSVDGSEQETRDQNATNLRVAQFQNRRLHSARWVDSRQTCLVRQAAILRGVWHDSLTMGQLMDIHRLRLGVLYQLRRLGAEHLHLATLLGHCGTLTRTSASTNTPSHRTASCSATLLPLPRTTHLPVLSTFCFQPGVFHMHATYLTEVMACDKPCHRARETDP